VTKSRISGNVHPQNAMRSFGVFISKIEWSKSESLKELFSPFGCLGVEKTKAKTPKNTK
jgi:hypothetical protein